MSLSWDQLGRAVVGWEYRAIVDVAVVLVSAAAGAGASTLTAYATYRLIAGRSDDNEIALPSALASGHHFAISADGANAYVEDLGSANGTYLSGTRVRGRTLLRGGDLIRVDDSCHIEFQSLTSSV